MNAIVEISGLNKVYQRRRGEPVVAVSDLNLSLGRPGSVHGFLGPNGSGKTTTIRCLLGLIRPSSGSVGVFGVDATTRFHEVAGRVGAIVENPKLFPPFTGDRNLRLLADMGGIPRSEVDRVLQVVGLADRGGDTFDSYSLGMKQRLAIAAALLKNPDLLILDEPANGLDPAGIAEMRTLIRAIANEGKAVLVSSHQLAEIEQVCDQVTIIHNGRLVVTGSLESVRTHAGPDQVVVSIVDREGAAAVLGQAGIAARPRPATDELTVEVPIEHSARVTETLARQGRFLHGLRTEKATLEAAFLNLTGGPPPPGAPSGPANAQTGGQPAPVPPNGGMPSGPPAMPGAPTVAPPPQPPSAPPPSGAAPPPQPPAPIDGTTEGPRR